MTQHTLRLAVAGLLVYSLSGCVAYGGPWLEPMAPAYHPHHDDDIRIPPGHLPPPGACRIWYPDRPPGQQPPPGNCHDLQYRVPRGATLVRG